MAVAFATVFLRGLFSVVTVYNAESCKSVKLRNNSPKLKTGEHCRSILSGVEVAGFEPAAFWSRIRGFGFPTEQCEFSPFSPGCAMKSPEFPKISGFFMPFLKWTFCLSG